MSSNTALVNLFCDHNILSEAALNALFETLHSNPIYNDYDGMDNREVRIYENPGTNACDADIANHKGWWVVVIEN